MSRARQHLAARRAGLAGAAIAALLLAGCSQVAAIAPVGGSHLAEVRFAANDLLVREGVDVLTAPVCTQPDDAAVHCEGETLDGEAIVVDSPADDPTSMTVVVGAATLYGGSIQDVLEQAMEAGS